MKLPLCVVDRWAGGSLTQKIEMDPFLSPGQGNFVNKM